MDPPFKHAQLWTRSPAYISILTSIPMPLHFHAEYLSIFTPTSIITIITGEFSIIMMVNAG
jgi:hypothetical protein